MWSLATCIGLENVGITRPTRELILKVGAELTFRNLRIELHPLAKMEGLMVRLYETIKVIQRTEANFKKMSKTHLNANTAKSRLDLLEQRWADCEDLHLQLKAVVPPEEREKTEYFSKNQFLTIEESYLNAHDFLINQIQSLSPVRPAFENLDQSVNIRANPIPVKLPEIKLPEFSGDFTEWENFRDLFDTLIIQNTSLSNVSRLYYLKMSLKGEAAKILRHVTIKEANFQSTWEMLKMRYDDNRALIAAHIQMFANIQKVPDNSAEELKELRDTTNEALAALKNLQRPVEQWSDLLVFLFYRN